jgi:predicted component of type VI protein secretion system
LLGLVRALITYGKTFSARLQHCPPGPAFTRFTRPFGTASLPQILARIACGLMRAAALAQRLDRGIERGQEINPSQAPASTHRRPATSAKSTPAKPRAPRPPADPSGLPSEAQIVAQARRQPVGAVIAAICRDFGMTPEQCGPRLWQELEYAITTFGGRIATCLRHLQKQANAQAKPRESASTAASQPEPSGGCEPASPRPPPPRASPPPTAATGPPPDWGATLAAA